MACDSMARKRRRRAAITSMVIGNIICGEGNSIRIAVEMQKSNDSFRALNIQMQYCKWIGEVDAKML